MQKFTPSQLQQLHEGYVRINSIDPCSTAGERLERLIDGSTPELLAQLACAEIKWVSHMARARLLGMLTTAIVSHRASGNHDAAARLEVAREYATNPAFRQRLSDYVFEMSSAK